MSVETPLTALVADAVRDTPDQQWIAFDDAPWTYRQLWELGAEYAQWLESLGVRPRERVASRAANGVEVFGLFLGCLQAGAVYAPLNTHLHGPALTSQVALLKPSLLVVETPDGIESDLVGVPSPPSVAVFGDRLPSVIMAGRPPSELCPERTSVILFTGGTTGGAKACMLSAGACVRLAVVSAEVRRLTPQDLVWTPLPLYHANAMFTTSIAVASVRARAAVASRFSVRDFWPAIARTEATVANLLGAPLRYIMDGTTAADARSLGVSLRLVMGNPFPPALQAEWKEKFGVNSGGAAVFGMTETGIVSSKQVGDVSLAGSAGFIRPEYQVHILGEDGRSVPDGVSGEITCRPRRDDVLFDGYWADDAATARLFRDGWFSCGDRGHIESGELFFDGRLADYIRRRGENISAADLEAMVGEYPDVERVAAVAVPAADGEDEILLCVVPTDIGRFDPAAFVGWLKVNVPRYAHADYLEILVALPESEVGRVIKGRLRNDWPRLSVMDLRERR